MYFSQSLPAKVRLAGPLSAAPFYTVPKINLFCTVQKQVRVKRQDKRKCNPVDSVLSAAAVSPEGFVV